MSSRLTTIPLPGLAIDPVIYSYGGVPRWIFTDEHFTPNGWLLLHSESLSDNNLNAFLRDGALGDMLIQRWRSYDAHQKTLYEESLAMRMLICTGAAFDGAYVTPCFTDGFGF